MRLKNLAKYILFFFAWVFMTILSHFVLQNIIFGYDFSYYWHAGSALFKDGLNPYSEQVAERILLSISNGSGISQEPNLFFAYALYALIVPLPLFFLPLDWAYTGWFIFNILILISFIPLFFPYLPKWLGLTTILFYEVWFTSIIGNYAGLVFLILLVSFLVLMNRDSKSHLAEILCGAALAWATAKPQMVAIFIVLLLLICLKEKRFWMLYSFFGTLLFLVLFSFLLVPTWLQDWLEIIIRYSQVAHKQSSLVGNFLASFIHQDLVIISTTILMLLAAIFLFSLTYSWYKGKRSLLLLIASYALVQVLFAPTATAPNRLVLIIPIFLYVVWKPDRISTKLIWGSSILLSNLIFFWGLMNTLPGADDKYIPLVFIIFLVFLFVRQKNLKQNMLQRSSFL